MRAGADQLAAQRRPVARVAVARVVAVRVVMQREIRPEPARRPVVVQAVPG
jgi:hypothetical protein